VARSDLKALAELLGRELSDLDDSTRELVEQLRPPARCRRAATLDGYQVASYDALEIERLRALGIGDLENDPTVLVQSGDDSLRALVQSVPESNVVKNRLRLDLASDDPDAEAERLEEIGAVRQAAQPNDLLVVLTDPEGNEFCILR
jgi:hypothetical protein